VENAGAEKLSYGEAAYLIGKSTDFVQRNMDAYEVRYAAFHQGVNPDDLNIISTSVLREIHAADRSAWPDLVKCLIGAGGTLHDVRTIMRSYRTNMENLGRTFVIEDPAPKPEAQENSVEADKTHNLMTEPEPVEETASTQVTEPEPPLTPEELDEQRQEVFDSFGKEETPADKPDRESETASTQFSAPVPEPEPPAPKAPVDDWINWPHIQVDLYDVCRLVHDSLTPERAQDLIKMLIREFDKD
jgi:hypothetical protein